jgi:hypothetical protein
MSDVDTDEEYPKQPAPAQMRRRNWIPPHDTGFGHPDGPPTADGENKCEQCIDTFCWPCGVFKGALGLGGGKTKRRRKKTKKRKSKRRRKKTKRRKSKRRRKKTKRKRKSHRKTKKRKKRRKGRSRTKHGGANLEEIPADGDRGSAKLIVRMLTNLEGMDRQTAIDQVVNAYKNRDRTRWQNYLANMNRIYGLAEGEENMLAAERRERDRIERIADRTRKPLAAQKEEEPTIGLAAQKIEE